MQLLKPSSSRTRALQQETAKVAQLCPSFSDPMDCSLPGSSIHRISPDQTTGVCSGSLLQGIFPTQELNWGLLHCRWILYQRSYQASPARETPTVRSLSTLLESGPCSLQLEREMPTQQPRPSTTKNK